MNNGDEPYLSQERMFKLMTLSLNYAQKANDPKASIEVKQRYLDYLVGSLDSLVLLLDPQFSDFAPADTDDIERRQLKIKRQKSGVVRFFTGD
jgi:hypothetical protein